MYSAMRAFASIWMSIKNVPLQMFRVIAYKS